MDVGFHLPEIGKLREQSGRCLNSVSKNITVGEGLALPGGSEKNTREKRRSREVEKSSTRKKRTNANDRQRKTHSKKASASSSVKSSRNETTAQNTRRKIDTIGLPKITLNIEEDTLKAHEGLGAKKPKRTKAAKGDTISYVYSKSLQDENTMAFLRNSVEFEKDSGTNYKIWDKKSSNVDKKPYGLPALKVNEELNVKRQVLNRDDFSEGYLTETDSLLNAWEAIDDDVSNGTTCDSTDCSTGNET